MCWRPPSTPGTWRLLFKVRSLPLPNCNLFISTYMYLSATLGNARGIMQKKKTEVRFKSNALEGPWPVVSFKTPSPKIINNREEKSGNRGGKPAARRPKPQRLIHVQIHSPSHLVSKILHQDSFLPPKSNEPCPLLFLSFSFALPLSNPIHQSLIVSLLHECSRVNLRSPLVAPPRHVPDMLPVGQTDRAARTHCSQRSLEMLTAAPSLTGSRLNLAEPECPVVAAGAPLHLVSEPAMPPQMDSWATFWSWKTILLGDRVSYLIICRSY